MYKLNMIPYAELSIASQKRNGLPLLLATLLLLTLSIVHIYSKSDPYNLRRIPTIYRSRISDARRSGTWWKLLFPELIPYLNQGYLKV
jgi:hypothetical protein